MPLPWVQSTTFAFLPDETHSAIRRVYTHPSQQHSKRQFCGYCGTPLSYWSEEPEVEAGYISLTLGSLLREDLRDLEDMGLIPDQSDEEGSPGTTSSESTALRQSHSVPWFDALVEGSQLGKLGRKHGIQKSEDSSVRIEWEVVDFTSEADEDMKDVSEGTERPGKRKLHERYDDGVAEQRK